MNLTVEYKNQVRQAHPEFTVYLTVREVMVLLTLSKSQVHNLVASGEIPATRIGKRILIYKDGVLEFLAERERSNPFKKLVK